MRRWFGVLVVGLVLWWPQMGAAQSALPWVFHGGATATADGNVLQADYYSTIVVQIEGTFVGTVTFEKKSRDASGWVAVQCTNASDRGDTATATTATGYWECPGGAYNFRARVSAYTSGTVIVTGSGTTAVSSSHGGGGGLTGWPQARVGEIPWANNEANAKITGDGTNKMKEWWDATEGYVHKPSPLGDSVWRIWPNFKGCIKDMEGDALVFCYDPDALTTIEMYAYQAGYRPLASVYVGAEAMHGDGTNCPADPTKVTISNQPRYTFVCTENNGSRIKGVIPMRANWDAGTIFIKPHYMQTAADTGSVALEVAAACRAFGLIFNGAYGAEIDIDDAAVSGSGAIDATLSAAVTPNGTCAAGDLLYFYIDVDATDNPTTAAATLHLLGADVFWRIKSPSH